MSRYATAVVGLIALGVAFAVPTTLINTIVGFAWAGVGSTFASITLLTLFWKRFSSKGVLAAMVTGVIFTIVWATSPYDSILSARAATFFVALFAAVVVTLMTKPDPYVEPPKLPGEN
jgi:sodium/proline symporter